MIWFHQTQLRQNLEQWHGFEFLKTQNIFFFFCWASQDKRSICSMSPWTWKTITLPLIKGARQQPQTLQSHQIARHVISLASSPCSRASPISASKLDKIGQGAVANAGGMVRISPPCNFFKGLDQTQVWASTQPARHSNDFEVFLNTMVQKWRKRRRKAGMESKRF